MYKPAAASLATSACVSVAILIAAALGGCTAQPTRSRTHHTATTAKTTASSTAQPGFEAPRASAGLTCDQVLPADFLAAAFVDSPVKTARPASGAYTTSYGNNGTNLTYHFRALGGLDCAWWDGIPFSGTGADPSYATATIVPVSSAVGHRLTRPYLSRPTGQGCSGGIASATTCWLVAYVNGYFVDVELYGIAGESRDHNSAVAVFPTERAAFDQLLDRVRSAPAAPSVWTPSSGTLPLPTTCAGFLSSAQLTTALGSSKPLYFGNFGDGYGSDNAAIEATQSELCTLQLRQVGHYSAGNYGYLGWLPGGAWAAAENAKLHASTALDIPGLQVGDSASTYWSRPGAELTTDLVVGGDWIEFTLNTTDTSIDQLGYTEDAAAGRLAARIVANLRR